MLEQQPAWLVGVRVVLVVDVPVLSQVWMIAQVGDVPVLVLELELVALARGVQLL